MIQEGKTLSTADFDALRTLMTGPDSRILRYLVAYFSYQSRYLHPRELRIFWESLTDAEKEYYRQAIYSVTWAKEPA